MKSLMTVLLSSFLGVVGISSVEAKTINDVNIKIVDSLKFAELNYKNSPDNEAIFYVNSDFILNNESKTVEEMFEYNNTIAEENLQLASKYYFVQDGITYDGEIYGSSTSTFETIKSKALSIMNDIKTDNYFVKNQDTDLYGVGDCVRVDSTWTKISEKKIDIDCTTSGEHFGDVFDWRMIYEIEGNDGYDYYAFINETYIKPDPYKTDYRTDDLTIKFKLNLDSEGNIRSYGPKKKNDNSTISYELNLGMNEPTNIEVSYGTLVDSPVVLDRGNMSNNYAEIFFDYAFPYYNSGKYYEYNISQTVQITTFITKVSNGTGTFSVRQDRRISILRDGFWSNKLAHFDVESEVVVNR